jgi:hypothetical protein
MTAQSRESVVTTPAGSRTTRQLQPCGTEAAWQRHIYRGEPVDEVCERAHRDYKRDWERAARIRNIELPPCTECGGARKPRQAAHGWCQACYCRWIKAGRPADGPPPRGAKRRSPWAGRREDYRWLRNSGETIAAAAQRIGIAEKTARKWEAAA